MADCVERGKEFPRIDQKTMRWAIYTVTQGRRDTRTERTDASNPFAHVCEAFWVLLEERETRSPEHPALGGGMRAGQMARVDRRPLFTSLDEWGVTYLANWLNHIKYNMPNRIPDFFKCKLEGAFHTELEAKELPRSTVNNAAKVLADAIKSFDPAANGVHPDNLRISFDSTLPSLPAKLRALFHASKPGGPEKLAQLTVDYCGILSQLCHVQPQLAGQGPPRHMLPLSEVKLHEMWHNYLGPMGYICRELEGTRWSFSVVPQLTLNTRYMPITRDGLSTICGQPKKKTKRDEFWGKVFVKWGKASTWLWHPYVLTDGYSLCMLRVLEDGSICEREVLNGRNLVRRKVPASAGCRRAARCTTQCYRQLAHPQLLGTCCSRLCPSHH